MSEEETKPEDQQVMEDVSIGVDSGGGTPAATEEETAEDTVEEEVDVEELAEDGAGNESFDTADEGAADGAGEETAVEETEEAVEETAVEETTVEEPVEEAKEETAAATVEEAQDVEAKDDEEASVEEDTEATLKDDKPAEKTNNPLEAVGSWFQKLGGGASRSEIEAVEEHNASAPSNVVMASDESEQLEIEQVEEEEEEAPTDQPKEVVLDEPQTKQAGWSLGVASLFGGAAPKVEEATAPVVPSPEHDEPLDIHPDEIKVEEDKKAGWGLGGLFGGKATQKGDDESNNPEASLSKDVSVPDVHPDEEKKPWGKNLGAMFRRNKKVGVDGEQLDKDTVKEGDDDDDDENAKKKGGIRQKCSAFYRSKEGQIVIFSCIALFLLLAILLPVFASSTADTELGTAFKNLGKVDTYLQAEMIKYPGYEGDLFPDGHATLRFDVENRFLATLRVGGLDQECTACSWSIAAGNTCHDANQVGELFYNHQDPALGTLNPFTATHYATKDGFSESFGVVYNGYDLDQNENRVLLMLDQQGISLACGVLKKFSHPKTYPKLWANMRSLPAYEQTSEVDVKVRVDFYADFGFHVGFTGTGLPPFCGMCLIAIHEGTSCEEAEGGTLWNTLKAPWDPWNTVNGAFYGTDSTGALSGRPGFYLYDGLDYSAHKNHVVIIRDRSNTAIACGQLRESAKYAWREASQQQVLAIGNAIDSGSNLIQHGYLRTNTNVVETSGTSIVVDGSTSVTADAAPVEASLVTAGVEVIHGVEAAVEAVVDGMQQQN